MRTQSALCRMCASVDHANGTGTSTELDSATSAYMHYVSFVHVVVYSVGVQGEQKRTSAKLTCTIIFCFGKRTYFFGFDRSKDHSKTKDFLGFVLVLPKQQIIVRVRCKVLKEIDIMTSPQKLRRKSRNLHLLLCPRDTRQ